MPDLVLRVFDKCQQIECLNNPENERLSLVTQLREDRVVPIDALPYGLANRIKLVSNQVLKTQELDVFVQKVPVNNQMLHYECRLAPFHQGEIVMMVRDITEQIKVQEERLQAAYYDSLTALPNRNNLIEQLNRSIEYQQKHPSFHFALMHINLNRFRQVNESLGYKAGDELLVAVAKRLKSLIRINDVVARFTGDDFAILLDGIQSEDEVIRIAERVRGAFFVPYTIREQELYAELSVGIITSMRESYTSARTMLRDAEIANRFAKSSKSQQPTVFDIQSASVSDSGIPRLQLETELHQALRSNQFLLVYQPIIHLQSGLLSGVEALIRWLHPRRGMIRPDQFIPVIEETELVTPVGLWVLKEACTQLRQWRERYELSEHFTVSVNLASKHFASSALVGQVVQVLKESDVDACHLKLEVTETAIMEHSEQVTTSLRQLQALGIKIDMDDFGTGYSSLSYLHRFPMDHLKIDRSFINLMAKEPDKAGIVRAIVALAGGFGMKTIAEGIETAEQLEMIKDLGCDYAQGYYFSRPLEPEAVEIFFST